MKAVCCFCDKSLEGNGVYEIKLTNWETKKEANIGRFFCHLACFKGKLHKNSKQIAEYMERHAEAE